MNANKIILIFLLLGGVAYGQTFNNTVTVQKDLRVQQETILGGVNKPVGGDMFVFYDSIYAPNIMGTGSIVTWDGGYFKLGTGTGGGGVSGLSPDQILFGKADGTIEQDPDFKLTTEFYSGFFSHLDGGLQIGGTSGDYSEFNNQGVLTDYYSNAINDGDILYGNSGGMYILPLGSADQVLKVKSDGSNIEWGSSSGETNTASNLGGGLANYDSKSGVDLRFNSFNSSDFNLASNLISLDYSNGQKATTSTIGFLTDTDWDTFNDKIGLVQPPTELTGQTASITTSNTVYTTPASDGYYRVSITATVTTAAGSTMDLAVQLRYTEATDNVVKQFPTANVNNYNRTQTNSTGATVSISSVCHVKASTDIKYYTTWSPTGGSPQYNIHITVEKIY